MLILVREPFKICNNYSIDSYEGILAHCCLGQKSILITFCKLRLKNKTMGKNYTWKSSKAILRSKKIPFLNVFLYWHKFCCCFVLKMIHPVLPHSNSVRNSSQDVHVWRKHLCVQNHPLVCKSCHCIALCCPGFDHPQATYGPRCPPA